MNELPVNQESCYFTDAHVFMLCHVTLSKWVAYKKHFWCTILYMSDATSNYKQSNKPQSEELAVLVFALFFL